MGGLRIAVCMSRDMRGRRPRRARSSAFFITVAMVGCFRVGIARLEQGAYRRRAVLPYRVFEITKPAPETSEEALERLSRETDVIVARSRQLVKELGKL